MVLHSTLQLIKDHDRKAAHSDLHTADTATCLSGHKTEHITQPPFYQIVKIE